MWHTYVHMCQLVGLPYVRHFILYTMRAMSGMTGWERGEGGYTIEVGGGEELVGSVVEGKHWPAKEVTGSDVLDQSTMALLILVSLAKHTDEQQAERFGGKLAFETNL